MNQDRYTMGKLFSKTDCIPQEMMVQYVDGLLSADQNRIVELHIVDCPLCDEAIEGIMECGTKEFNALVDRVSAKMEEHLEAEPSKEGKVIEFRPNINPPQAGSRVTDRRGSGIRKALPYVGIAASIALIVTLGILFIFNDSASKIANRHFELMAERGVRGTVEAPTPADPLDEAIALYGANEFEKAVVMFDQDGSSKSALLAGDCYFKMGKFDLAVLRYKKVIDAQQGDENEAEYKLALTYLQQEEIAQARMLLEGIAKNANHDYHAPAVKTLEEVMGL